MKLKLPFGLKLPNLFTKTLPFEEVFYKEIFMLDVAKRVDHILDTPGYAWCLYNVFRDNDIFKSLPVRDLSKKTKNGQFVFTTVLEKSDSYRPVEVQKEFLYFNGFLLTSYNDVDLNFEEYITFSTIPNKIYGFYVGEILKNFSGYIYNLEKYQFVNIGKSKVLLE